MYYSEEINLACEYLIKNDISLDSKQILFTGATGFVGSWLLSLATELQSSYGQNIELHAVSRDLVAAKAKLGSRIFNCVNWIEGDISELNINGLQITHAIHGATPTTAATGSGDINLVRSACVDGLRNLIKLGEKQNNKVRILHTSSGTVYQGETDEFGRSNLDLSILPNRKIGNSKHNGYLEAKLEAEKILNKATAEKRISGVNARLFAFFGPGIPINSHYAIGNFMRDAMYNARIEVQGTGKAVRAYMSGSEMAAKIYFSLFSKVETPFHIGSTEGRTLEEWASIVGNVFKKDVAFMRKFDDSGDSYVAGIDEKLPHFKDHDSLTQIESWGKYLVND